MQTTFTANDRTYTVVDQTAHEATARHLIARGFDGNVYFAEAKPVARQRKTFTGMFYRKPCGQFVNALS